MSVIRKELINVAINRAIALIDYNIHNDIDKQHEFIQQTVLADKSFTNDEITEVIRRINKIIDRNKVLLNKGTRRICENCNQVRLAISYCEYCVRNYLKLNFLNWTSGNNVIDNLIQKCQMETFEPEKIVEWIPYDNLQNIKYLTKGGFSEIYTAVWNDGRYYEWDSTKQQLTRFGIHDIVLRRLENVGSADQSWFEEAKSHLTISNKSPDIVNCYGLTQDPSNGNYMLVMSIMDLNLREYLQQNYNKLTWKSSFQFAYDIATALKDIHEENAIHRDLHSGNILFDKIDQRLFISDLGFCGPADKSQNSIYGNLPYIAPEVISGKHATKASDIYSIAMLMWEISSGKPPFNNYEHDYYLAMNIINGIRPRIVSGTPLEYKKLMKQCWDADTLKRPDIKTLQKKINEIHKKYLNMPNELEENNYLEINKTNSLEKQKKLAAYYLQVAKFIILKIFLNQEMQQKVYYHILDTISITNN
ncbi:polo kinase CDC5 [Rhizophagus irregularis DAOM 197198w]|uniref:Polo kinase CDC5 n=2 Tax=Rhizophagus irregularis TaxID=588596 RepID=A0A015IAH1_RHIIW|nr:polo kinase CDC5 [Rhizophagus irregularis DAOM 197198w]